MIAGRWSEQCARLHEHYQTIFYLIEGDLAEGGLGVPFAALWSALLNAELRRGSHVIRTSCPVETASVVRLLVQKGNASPPVPSGIAPATALTKRKRDAQPGLVFMRQLMCIPMVTGAIAHSFQIRGSRGQCPK